MESGQLREDLEEQRRTRSSPDTSCDLYRINTPPITKTQRQLRRLCRNITQPILSNRLLIAQVNLFESFSPFPTPHRTKHPVIATAIFLHYIFTNIHDLVKNAHDICIRYNYELAAAVFLIGT